MQNCRAIQTLSLQSCSWETFSNRECSLESSKACFINQLNPVSSSLQLQRCGDRDGWETGALSEITPQHCKTQQRGPLQWGALPRSASRKGKGWALSHPNSPWANAVPAGQDLLSSYCKQHSCDATSREDNFPFIHHHVAVRMAKQNGPVSHQFSGSLDSLSELTKWQPWKADLLQHNGHTVILEKVQLLELRIWLVWTHPKISCASIWC